VVTHGAMAMNTDRSTRHRVVLVTSGMLAILALKVANVGDGSDVIGLKVVYHCPYLQMPDEYRGKKGYQVDRNQHWKVVDSPPN